MKSLSKVYPSETNKRVSEWRVTDLDVQSNVVPADVQSEHILALFGTGAKSASLQRDGEPRSNVHHNETTLSLTSWLPDEIDLEPTTPLADEWEFAAPTSDFFNIPEQQIWKEKFDAEKERVELIRQARAEAQNILLQAHEEAEQIIQQAWAEIEQAKKDAYVEVRNELQGALSAAHAIVDETHQWQADLLKSSEHTLMDMLKEIAQTIFGEGVHLDHNALQVNLNRIMENAQRLGDLTIFLNSQDANQLDASWRDYQLLVTGNKVRIIPSEKIKPGGCVIKGSTGMVDARVETQLNSVLNTIDEVNEVSK